MGYYEHYDEDGGVFLEYICPACSVGGCECYLLELDSEEDIIENE